MRTLCIAVVVAASLLPAAARAAPRPCAQTGEDATDERTAAAQSDGKKDWRDTAGLVALGVGGVLGVAAPAVVVGGIVLDDEPSTPPVEAFVLGAALGVAAVVAVITGGIARASADDDCPPAAPAAAGAHNGTAPADVRSNVHG